MTTLLRPLGKIIEDAGRLYYTCEARASRLWQWVVDRKLVYYSGLAGLGWLGYRMLQRLISLKDFNLDDAYISLRYAENWYRYGEIVWNQGEPPIEGFSNFLLVFYEYVLLHLSLPVMEVVKATAIIAAAGCLVLLWLIAGRLLKSRLLALLPPAFLAGYAPFLYNAVNGLETVYYCFLLLGAYYLFLLGRRYFIFASVVFFLAAITRPEGILLFIIVSLFVLVRVARASRRRAYQKETLSKYLPLLLPCGLLFLGFLLFRLGYFGYILPNSYYYKADHGDAHFLKLVRAFFNNNTVFFALGFLAIFRRHTAHRLIPILFIVVQLVLFLNVLPSVSRFFRFFIPLVPFLFLVNAFFLESFFGKLTDRRLKVALALVLYLVVTDTGVRYGSIENAALKYKHGKAGVRHRVGRFLADNYPAKTLAVGDCGVIAWRHQGKVYDLFGLNSLVFTHQLAKKTRPYAGYILDKRPDVIAITSKSMKELKPRYGRERKIARTAVFKKEYKLVKKFANYAKGKYNYWVYERVGGS